MNEELFDYCKVRLTDPKRKPDYQKVTNESFANFLIAVSDCIDDLRKLYDFYFDYINHEKDFKYNSLDLEILMDEGLSAILSYDSSSVTKENGAEQIRNAAYCGLRSASFLLAIHSICDSRSSEDHDIGCIMLNKLIYEALRIEKAAKDAKQVLDYYYTRYPAPYMNADEKDKKRFSIAYSVKDGQLILANNIGEFIGGWNVVGNIRIYCDWFKKPIEIIYKNDQIDVYAIPSLPIWYLWKCIYDKVGGETMNDLAGVRICDIEQTETSYPPVILRREPAIDLNGITQTLGEGQFLTYLNTIISFERKETIKLSYKKQEEGLWTVYFPQSWDELNLQNQRSLTKYVNNILPKIAESVIPQWYEELIQQYDLPKGKCSITLAGDGERYENSEGGLDVTVPFNYLKLPPKMIFAFLLWPFADKHSETAHLIKQFYNYVTDGQTTGWFDYKLLISKMKRISMVENCAEKLYGAK